MPVAANSAVNLGKSSTALARKQRQRYCRPSNMQDSYVGQHAAEEAITCVPMLDLDLGCRELGAIFELRITTCAKALQA